MLRFGELFAGAGGMALGLKQAGLEPAWAIDFNADACETYRRNIGGHALCAKVEDVDFASLPAVDGLAFGFPCNDFSVVGEKKGRAGYYGGLYLHAVRAIDHLKPMWFIAENVPGLISNGGSDIMQAFADAGPGYRVTVHQFRFDEYGVPQRRSRVIGVGIRRDLGLAYVPPAPTHKVPVTARQALAGVDRVDANNEKPRHSARVISLLEHIPPGGNCWHPSVPAELQLNVPNVRMSLIYRRLHPDEPSYTIVAAGGGGTHTYHWKEPRALTNRERARLQSFPDDYVFWGSASSVRKQIGMAVPPAASKVIGESLLACLAGRPYASCQASVGVLCSGSAVAPDMVLSR